MPLIDKNRREWPAGSVSTCKAVEIPMDAKIADYNDDQRWN